MKHIKINPLTQYEFMQIQKEIHELSSKIDLFEEYNIESNYDEYMMIADRLDYLISVLEASLYWTRRSQLKLIDGGKQNEN